jgi:EpsI family protein
MQSTLILDGHYGFGWTVFAIATVAYFVAMHRWTPLRSSMSVTTPCAAIAWAPIACVAVLCGVAALHAGWKEAISERWVLSVELLDAGTGWDRAEGESSLWTPGFSGPQAEATAQYRQGDAVVTWYSALYGSQGPGQKLIGHGSSLAGPGWTVRSDRLDAGTNRRRVAELQSDDGERVLVKYWYCIGSSGTIALREVKWLEARQWLYPRQPSRVVAVGARCGGDCEGADALLERFLAAHADSVSDTQHVAHSRS